MTHHLLQRAGELTIPDDVSSYELDQLRQHAAGQPAFLPAPIEALNQVAHMLCEGGIVPHLTGNKGRSMAVAWAAARHNMDPIAFAGETYFTPVKGGGERLAYQSKLVSALITSSPLLVGRLRATLHGAGSQRFCHVTGRIKGEVEPFEYTSPIIGQIKPKHSPLWFSEPDQQLIYYSKRGWCRRNAEDILLGVYDPDEFDARETDEVRAKRDAFDESDLDAPPEPSAASAVQPQQGGDTEDGHPNAPPKGGRRAQRREPEPPAASTTDEPDDMPEVRAACLAKVEALLKEPPAMIAGEWEEFVKSKDWGRLKAYNLEVATQLGGRMARHLKGGGTKPD